MTIYYENPSWEKTWEFSANNIFVAPGSNATTDARLQNRSLLFFFVSKLIDGGTFTTPWIVTRSSDSVTTASSNLWLTESSLVWADSALIDPALARSWIVLQHPVFSLYMLIDLVQEVSGIYTRIDIILSNAAWTGGSTTARPTTTGTQSIVGQHDVASDARWGAPAVALRNVSCNIAMSSDGEEMYAIFYTTAGVSAFWRIGRIAGDQGMTYPYYVIKRKMVASSDAVTVPSYANLQANSYIQGYTNAGVATTMNLSNLQGSVLVPLTSATGMLRFPSVAGERRIFRPLIVGQSGYSGVLGTMVDTYMRGEYRDIVEVRQYGSFKFLDQATLVLPWGNDYLALERGDSPI